MPAKTSRIGFSVRRSRGVAYSDKYRAAPIPSGAATSIAMTAMSIVPRNSVRMSNSLPRGTQPLAHSNERSMSNSHEIASPISARTMARLTTSENSAAAWNRVLTSRSLRRRRALPVSRSALGVTVVTAMLLTSSLVVEGPGPSVTTMFRSGDPGPIAACRFDPIRRQRDVPDLRHELVHGLVGQVVVHVGLQGLALPDLLVVHVDEQRS